MSRARQLADSADLSFDDGTLVVDSANNRVGIGTSSPTNTLQVTGNIYATTTIRANGGNTAASPNIAVDGGTGMFKPSGNTVAFTTTSTERMRIDTSGNLLVGTTQNTLYDDTSGSGLCYRPQLSLDIAREATSSGNYMLSLNNTGVDAKFINFGKDGTGVGSIGVNGSDIYIGESGTALDFNSSSSQILPFSVNAQTNRDDGIDLGGSAARFKDLYLSGGVYLGGTGAANQLDDYEEGSWTPTTSVGTVNATQSGYIKVGRKVTLWAKLDTFSERSSASTLDITGLPFTPNTTYDNNATGSAMWRYINQQNTITFVSSTPSVRFYGAETGDFEQIRYNDIQSTNSQVYFVATYFTA